MSNQLYALARISRYLNEHKGKMLMKSFIVSQVNYCPIIWMYCQRKSNNLINQIHERALRIAYDDYVSHIDSLLEKDESVTIHQRNIQVLASEIYKTQKDLNPKFMKEIFSMKKHNYPMRKQPLEYPNPRTVTYGLGSVGYKASQIWNSIPNNIQEANDLCSFKSFTSEHCKKICKCNLCKLYVKDLGYIARDQLLI